MHALTLGAAAFTALLAPFAKANPVAFSPEYQELISRATTGDAAAAADKAFDFIIVGGGLAGLTVAGRLSEWNNVTVLVLEAGGTGEETQDFKDRVDIPGKSYAKSLSNTEYDWKYETIAQTKSGNVKKSWPRGKILGGSGAINGLFWCRGDKEEYDAWGSLNPGTNHTWDWNEVNQYIMKSENFMEPPTDMVNSMSLKYDSSLHGVGGPISVGYSQYIYPVTSNWIPSWTELGFPAKDLAGGSTRGVMLTPSTLNRDTQARCDSKCGYLTPNEGRANLVVLTGQQVTKIVFNGTNDAQGNPIASGVTFSAGEGQQVYSAQAKKEVILSGGTVGSAQILQLSGIGPANILQRAGVEVIKDLPVGYNLQDHVSNTMYFDTQPIDTWYALAMNDPKGIQAEEEAKWKESATGMWTYVNEAVGYISGKDLYGTTSAATDGIDIASMIATLDADLHMPESVKNGLRAQLDLQQQWLATDVGQFEIILHLWGQKPNNIGIQVALQHPFSRGTLFISSASAWDYPTINPNYFGIDRDAEMGAQAQAWVRKLVDTPTWKKIITAESPRSAPTGPSDQEWYALNGKTEYHPLGTCSMLPEDQGGVVDTSLRVYGISNVRVIDASIMPIQISAHLMASTYGIAEKGADIIKAKYVYVPPPPPPTSTTSGVKATATSSETHAGPATTAEIEEATDSAIKNAAADSNASNASGEMSLGTKIGVGVGVGCGVLALLAAILFVVGAARKNKRKAATAEKGWYAGPTADQGAWDAGAAYSEQEGYPMAPPRGRPFSTAGASVSTMATTELYHPRPESPAGEGYHMGDYSRGGAQSPYRDFIDEPPRPSTPGSLSGSGGMPSPTTIGSQWGAQTYTPVTPR